MEGEIEGENDDRSSDQGLRNECRQKDMLLLLLLSFKDFQDLSTPVTCAKEAMTMVVKFRWSELNPMLTGTYSGILERVLSRFIHILPLLCYRTQVQLEVCSYYWAAI